MTRRWTLASFVLVAAVQIAPLWSVRYLPAGDGPTHVYNAWVLHELLTGDPPPNIDRAYAIDWRPHPNWTGHALMALAMFVVPPLVAEKLLLTLALALLFAGAWLLCTAVDARNGVYAFFVFPFAWGQHFVAGYYNYSLSIGLFLIILAMWWKRRPVWLIAALLVLCYFTHPMATVLACTAIGLLSIATRRFAALLALIPVAPLLVLFGRSAEAGAQAPRALYVDWEVVRILGTAEVVQSLSGWQRMIGIAIAILFAILSIITLVCHRRRPENALALVALAFAAAMFWLPASAGTRALFSQRTSQFLFPVLAAWLTPRIAEKWRAALAVVLALLALANAWLVFAHVLPLGADNAAFVRTFDHVEPETRMLPLFFDRPQSGTIIPLFVHRISYAALEKRLVDYSNYEPGSNYFPLRWREPVDASAIELAPGSIDVTGYAPRADYVVTYALPKPSPQRSALQGRYVLVRESGELRIYRRKAPLTGQWDSLLLPFLGTRTDLGAPHGARWRIEQRIANRGTHDVRIVFRNCLDDMPCDFTIAPNAMLPVTTDEHRFMLIQVPRGDTELLDITTVVRRADVERPELSIQLPAVHERDFSDTGLRFENVAVRGRKVGLRLYLFSEKPWEAVPMRVRDRATNAVVGERVVEMQSYSLHENADLRTDFRGLDAEAVDIEIDAPQGAKIWAFTTSADQSGRTQLHFGVRRP